MANPTDGQIQGLKKELARTNAARRKVLSQSRDGIITVKVSESPAFRLELAQRIVQQAHPGYSSMAQGSWYCDPVTDELFHTEVNRQWNPWPDSVDWRIVGIEELFDPSNDYSDEVDWEVQFGDIWDLVEEMVSVTMPQDVGNLRDEDGDLSDWAFTLVNVAVEWGEGENKWADMITAVQDAVTEETISFAKANIKDEIQLRVTGAEVL